MAYIELSQIWCVKCVVDSKVAVNVAQFDMQFVFYSCGCGIVMNYPVSQKYEIFILK